MKSTDRGQHWRAISPDLSDEAGGPWTAVPFGTITMLSESRFGPGVMYAGTEGGGVETMVAPPISMGIFAYPHREGARLTMQLILGWLDAEEHPGVDDYVMLVSEDNYVKNLKTVYRESEDQFPGIDCTRQYRKRRF